MLRLSLASLLLFFLSATAQADGSIGHDPQAQKHQVFSARVTNLKAAFEWVAGNNCGDPCVLPTDHDARYALGLAAAIALISGAVPPRMMVINGRCIGACTVFAAHAKKFFCVGPNARIMLYRIAHATNYRDPPLPEAISAWVRKRTGLTDEANIREKTTFPLARSLGDALVMMYDDAVQFWEPCDEQTLIASAR